MIALHCDAQTPDAVKLIVALAETGLEYETVIVPDRWAPAHRALAPQGELPVLVEDGFVMREAAFALQYLGEAHARHLVPADPWAWYEVQALNQQIDAALGPAVNLLGWTAATTVDERTMHRAWLASIEGRQKPAGWHAVWADAEANEDQLANARERIEGGLEQLEGLLVGSDWLVGGTLSLADINAFALVRAVGAVTGASVTARPALARWLGRMESRAPVLEEVAFSAPA